MKRAWIGVCLAMAAAGLTACLPSFPTDGVLTVVPGGSGGTISWPSATDADADQTIASYRIDVDGIEVSRVPGTENSCVLSGLTSGGHLVAVTAYDSHGDWSGAASSGSRVSAEVTAPDPEAEVAPPTCVALASSSEDSIVISGVVVSAAVDPTLRVSLVERSVAGIAPPEGVDLGVAGLDIRVTGLDPNGVGEVSLDLSEPVDSVETLADGGWDPFAYDGETGAQVAGEGTTLVVAAKDGGRGDADEAVNGVVSVSLGLGKTEELGGAPNPSLELPKTAPGWDEARPAIAAITPPGSWAPTRLVVYRINAAGELQYTMALGNIWSGLILPLDDISEWSTWTTIPGTGRLVGSPSAATANSLLAVGDDGHLKRLTNGSGVLPATSAWSVTDLPALPDGLTIIGSPAGGGVATVEGSDGGLWSFGGTVWTRIADPQTDFDGPVETTSVRIGTSVNVVLGVDQTGGIATEVSQGIEGTFIAGSGFVGTPAAVSFGPGAAGVAVVRSDGYVTVMSLNYKGQLQAPDYWYTVGQPGPPEPKSPVNGSLVAPGTSVKMTVNPSYGATDYRWTLFEAPLSGGESQVASETLAGAAGTSWTLPAITFRNGARYRWQAEAFRSDTGLYKRVRTLRFFTVTDGLAPAQKLPVDGADVMVDSTGSTVLTTGVVPGATSYRFTLARKGVQTRQDDVTCCTDGETSVAWTVPEGWIIPGGTYLWSVQAIFSGTAGAPGPARSFTAITSGDPPVAPSRVSPGEGALIANVGSWVSLSAASPTNGHVREYRFELWEHTPGGRTWAGGYTSVSDHLNPSAAWDLAPGTLEANRTYEWTVRVYDLATRQLSGWPTPRMLRTTTNTLRTDEVLTPGNELNDSGYRLVMQTDGNIVIYRPDGGVQAATNRLIAPGSAYPYLVMQSDGNLVEYQNQPGGGRRAIWASGTRGSGTYLLLQGDGNAVVYRPNAGGTRTPLWASNSLIPKPPPPPGWGGGGGYTIDGVVPSGARVAAAANAEPRYTLSARGIHPGDSLSFAIALPRTGLPLLNSAQISSARASAAIELIQVSGNTRTNLGNMAGTWSQAEQSQHRLGNLTFRGVRSGLAVGKYEIRVTYRHPTLMAAPAVSRVTFEVFASGTPIPGVFTTANLAPSKTYLKGVCGSAGGAFLYLGITGQICWMFELEAPSPVYMFSNADFMFFLTGNSAIFGTVEQSGGASLDLSGLAVLSNGTFQEFKAQDSCISVGAWASFGVCWKDSGTFPSINMKAALYFGGGLGAGVSFAIQGQNGQSVSTRRLHCFGTCGGPP